MKMHLPQEQSPDLSTILIIGHGDFPFGLKSALEMISGDTRNTAYLCFEQTDDPDSFGEKITEIIASAPSGCLVLIDLMGGTPCNQCCMHLRQSNCQAVCGVNLAMLLEVASAREGVTLEELAQTAVDAGGIGIVDVVKRLKSR